MHNLCKNEIMESVPIFMATAVCMQTPVPNSIREDLEWTHPDDCSINLPIGMLPSRKM